MRKRVLPVSSELVQRAQHGDHDAFEVLASRAYHRLYAVARRILRDPAGAEDAVQDALVRAWRDLPGLRDPERFEAWLHRLLVHACADQARRSRRRPEVALPWVELAESAPGRDPFAGLVDRDEIERAFLGLSVEHRAVLVMVHYLGMSAPEVARVLGVPPGTVYSRLHYGAARMREQLGGPMTPGMEQGS